MMSYVIVHVGWGKEQRIQTMPNMVLSQIVYMVCKRRNDRHPESYCLKKGDNVLDLSMTIHRTEIVSGSRLDLVKHFRGTSASSHFNIALQFGANKTKDSISPAASTSLRELLLAFEHANITNPQSAPTHQHYYPQTPATFLHFAVVSPNLDVQHQSIESSTIAIPADFSESRTGVVRVLMPCMNTGINHFMSDYNDNDDVNINESESTWSFDIATPLSSSLTVQSSTSPASTTKNTYNNSTATPSKVPSSSSFFTPVPLAQPNNDKPLSGNFSIPLPFTMPVPSLTARAGTGALTCRDGPLPSNAGSGGNGSDGDSNRQTPAQNINAAMIEANQEIRQRLEQQTQEALTDRVRCLSKNSDSSSDKDRFLRSMQIDGYNNNNNNNQGTKKNQQQLNDIVRQIALRVSRMLKEAEDRGEAPLDYQTLIAQEIAKEQQTGLLPPSFN